MNNIFKNKYFIAAWGVFFIFLLIFISNLYLGDNKTSSEKIKIEVYDGMSVKALKEELLEKKILLSPITFEIFARVTSLDDTLQKGNYYMKEGSSIIKIMDTLKENKNIQITIPEGYTVEEIANLLDKNEITSKEDFLELAKDYRPFAFMEKKANAKYAVEGFLFPDTYEFSKGDTAKNIMDRMLSNFNQKALNKIKEVASPLSIYEVVTLASIVEKEAKFDEDRPIIAQVLLERLKIHMPLQSDATIQYAIPFHKEEFTIKDTKFDSIYNTYLHYGLPPGPIANPGLSSIEAVLHPKDTNFLYFVADENGKNHYSKTYKEHEDKIKMIYKD